jgi:ribose/xylose/arabinose/galactoside ABC-type transport system permease subunit
LVTQYYTGAVLAIDLATEKIVDRWPGISNDNLARQIAIHPQRDKAYIPHIRSRVTSVHGEGSIFPYVSIIDTESGGGSRRRRVPMDAFLGNLVPYNVLVWAAVAVVVIVGLRRTGLGRMLYAVGDNPVAARLAGVRTWQVLLAAYTLRGLFAALAGILIAGQTGAVDLRLAQEFLLPSVAAAVIGGTSIFGGTGSYSGTILGALILSVLNTMLTFLNAPQSMKQVVFGLIVLGLAWLYAAAIRSE